MHDKFKERYTPPTKYDQAPFGDIVKFVQDGDDYELYIQLSQDKEVADWKKVRYLLEKVFEPFIVDKNFITECLKINQGERDFSNIVKILEKKCLI